MNTLTQRGIDKIAERFVEAIDHASYTLNGQPKTMKPFRKTAEEGTIKVYVYFDDTVAGSVENVQLVDSDGDVVAQAEGRSFSKPTSKGLYVAFKYNIKEKEMEVEVTDATV